MSPESPQPQLPVVVIGAGPIGLTAAHHLVERGIEPVVLEAGPHVGAAVRAWGHVRVFSPWKYMVDPVAHRALARRGWVAPDPELLPTGDELVAELLEPLAEALGDRVRLSHRVRSVTRSGVDKTRSASREERPFVVTAETPGGVRTFVARAVIDASGTFGQPNPLGAAGVPAEGETAHRDVIDYGIPDVLGRVRERYEEQRVLVVGSGHSAFNVLLDLVRLKLAAPRTRVSWALRRSKPGQMFGGGDADALPGRGSLGASVRRLVDLGLIDVVYGFAIGGVVAGPDGVRVRDGTRVLGPFDRIVASTGFRPDLDMLRELRLDLDPVLESTRSLAPLIDPNVHSCGTVYPHGYRQLRHPDENFFAVGMKSYGRAPSFLLWTGYEQVRSVVSALAGDMEAALNVVLELPPTGVCSTGATACCGTTGEPARGEAPGLAAAEPGLAAAEPGLAALDHAFALGAAGTVSEGAVHAQEPLVGVGGCC